MMQNKTIFLGAGCFWGVEEIFRKVPGVISTEVGYMGGSLENPTYEDICTGQTGHAEVVKVVYSNDSDYLSLLKTFFKLHDPTSLNRQGVDIGTQYRSAIFTSDKSQKEMAENIIDKIENHNVYPSKITTEVKSADQFYPAEDYHQKYYLKKYSGGSGPICHFMRPIDFSFL